ncbi:interferon regulatory factor 9 isoform X1 [Loxodonta africana]|uniref:interferon regulatory factor 9 isoform X1 n=1 Tax=Loxodonta africana TaxID=9785 RepID=UPI00054054F2|nr:interferon regulatory factor 9 isoform X1 [Loxodonta africana]
MASGKARCTRKLRNWVVEQVESGKFPGVCWDDEAKTMFRIPWKHAGKQDFREDQDAAFFKAWAIFKGKYKEGNSEGPATWKTRLRCALNKSSEFQEVPERGRMDGAEPYKVYRLLPPGTLLGPDPSLPSQQCSTAEPGTQKSPSKRHHSSESSDREEDESPAKSHVLSPFLLQDPFNNERGTSGGADHSDTGSSGSSSSGSSGSNSNSNSPKPQEGTDTTEAPFEGDQASVEFVLPPDLDYSLLLTFIYNGRVVGETQVHTLDCRLVAEPSDSQSSMKQVVFPKADPLEPTQRVLSQLKRGVLMASNPKGLFVQRLCPIPISWDAPQTPPGPGPHLLPSNECVELFKTAYFYRDLARYNQGLGPPPKFQVTLNFLEESSDPSQNPQSLITVQMEQAFARHLLERTMPEEQAATLPLSLEDPPAFPSLFFLSPLNRNILHTGDLNSSVIILGDCL